MSDHANVEIAYGPPIDPAIDTFLSTVGFGFNPGQIRRQCRREIHRLNAKSDAELFLIGLRRCDIPAHVMRHRFPGFAP